MEQTVEQLARALILDMAGHGAGTSPWPAELGDPRFALRAFGEAASVAVLLLDELAAAHGLTVRAALDRFAPVQPEPGGDAES